MQFYTYVWYDQDWIPYYCGKGCGTRCYRRRDIPQPAEGHVVLKYFDTEEEAFEHERQLISFWGRRGIDTNGLLENKSLGGPGVPGLIHSAETRAKISAAKKGPNHPNYGKQLSSETRVKLSAALSGANNPNYGKQLASETRAKLSAARKGKKHSAETRAKISASLAETVAKLSKTYVVISPNGDSRVIRNLTQFCRDHDLDQGHMFKVAKGKRKHHKGWKVRHA